MNSAELRTALQELSDEVRTPDLLDRALRTSRHIRRRRIAVAVTGTVVAVVATIVAVAPWHGSDSGLPPATKTPPPSPTTSAPETTEYPIAGQTMTYPPGQEPAVLRGTSFYLTYDEKPAGSHLVRAHAGKVERTELPTDVFGTASISPNGKKIAWVKEDGALVVADITGANQHPVASDAVPAAFNVPGWTPDSASIVYSAAGGPTMRVPAGGGQPVQLWDSSMRYPVWSADGKHLGFLNGTGGAGVLDVQHGTVSPGPDLTNFGNPRYLGGIAPDGSRILVNFDPLRTGRSAQGFTLIDVATSEERALPLTPVSGALLLPNGDFLLRMSTPNGTLARQVTPGGTVVAESFEPQGVLRATLIAFTAD